MFTARTAWLLGDEPPMGLLAETLQSHGCRAERIASADIERLLDRVRHGALPLLPNLVLLGRDVAGHDGDAALKRLSTRAPWRLVPLVVVSAVEDAEACRAAYAAGASSWTVVPPDAPDVAEAFARYWLDTAMLPPVVAAS